MTPMNLLAWAGTALLAVVALGAAILVIVVVARATHDIVKGKPKPTFEEPRPTTVITQGPFDE